MATKLNRQEQDQEIIVAVHTVLKAHKQSPLTDQQALDYFNSLSDPAQLALLTDYIGVMMSEIEDQTRLQGKLIQLIEMPAAPAWLN